MRYISLFNWSFFECGGDLLFIVTTEDGEGGSCFVFFKLLHGFYYVGIFSIYLSVGLCKVRKVCVAW